MDGGGRLVTKVTSWCTVTAHLPRGTAPLHGHHPLQTFHRSSQETIHYLCQWTKEITLPLHIKYTCIMILVIGSPNFLFKMHLSGHLGTKICTSELYQQRNASLSEPLNYSGQEKQGKKEGPLQGHGLS